jgi:hypothetical protein
MEDKIAIHPLEIFLIGPAETGHAAILYRGSTVFTGMLNAVHGDPEKALVADTLYRRDLGTNLVWNGNCVSESSTEDLRVQNIREKVNLAFALNVCVVGECPDCAQCTVRLQTVLVRQIEIRPTAVRQGTLEGELLRRREHGHLVVWLKSIYFSTVPSY